MCNYMTTNVWGMVVDASNIIIQGNIMVHEGSQGGSGVQVNGGTDIHFLNNYIHNFNNGFHLTAGITYIAGTIWGTITTYISGLGFAELPGIVFPFVEGSDWQATAPWGWQVDTDAEYAATMGWMPDSTYLSQRIKIYAVTLTDEADAMRLQLEAYAGASDEPYTTETIAVANKASTTTNMTNGDVIYWEFTSADDVDIDDITRKDAVLIKVLHEAAGNGDCATNAKFLCAVVEYV